MKRILCLWFPNWSIQRLVVARPELAEQPLVLYGRDPRRGQIVMACSEEACDAGVKVGIPLTEATSLLRRSGRRASSLHVEPYDARTDADLLRHLAEWCERYSPTVGVDPASPDTLLLDVTGLAQVFGGEEVLAGELSAELLSQGYDVRLAIADTVGAAWAVAHAVDYSQVILPGECDKAINVLPITALRIEGKTVELLHALGVERVEQLLQLPRTGLANRFGNELLQRIDQALGKVDEVIVTHRASPKYYAEQVLEYPLDGHVQVKRVLQPLVGQIVRLLHTHDHGVLRLDCRLDCVGSKHVDFRVDLFRPTASPRYLLDLIDMHLEHRSLPAPICRISLQASLTARLQYEQGELFSKCELAEIAEGKSNSHGKSTIPGQPEIPTEDVAQAGAGRGTRSPWEERHARSELARLIDRLGSRLGHASVVCPSLRADVEPERAFTYAPWSNLRVSAERTTSGNRKTRLEMRERELRPLCLFAHPVAMEVLRVKADGCPMEWHWRGRRYRVRDYQGPERLETGWWRRGSISRDYYRLQTEQGQRFWVFMNRTDGQWFLQGTFE